MCRALIRHGLRGRPGPVSPEFQNRLKASIEGELTRRRIAKIKEALVESKGQEIVPFQPVQAKYEAAVRQSVERYKPAPKPHVYELEAASVSAKDELLGNMKVPVVVRRVK